MNLGQKIAWARAIVADSLGSVTRDAIHDLSEVLLPTECLGCGAWDEVVCDKCLAKLLAKPQILEFPFEGLDFRGTIPPVLAVAPYAGEMRRLVLAGKHDKRRDLSAYFAAAGENAVISTSSLLTTNIANTGFSGLGEVFVVPAPSTTPKTPSEVGNAFAQGVMLGLVKSKVASQCGVLEILKLKPGAKKQSGLGLSERASNRHHQMYLAYPDAGAQLTGKRIVLVDDVTTTGSTLREMARALRQARVEILGCYVFAATHLEEKSAEVLRGTKA